MKTTLRIAILTLALFLGMLGMALGQVTAPGVWVDVSQVEGLTPEGLIPAEGTTLVIPIRFLNSEVARTAVSNGYGFTGDVTHTGLSGHWSLTSPWSWDIAFTIGCYPPACYPYFDQGTFINYFENGVGFAGLTGASGSGLPPAFDGVAYEITLTGVIGEPGEILVMDTTWWPPANFWLWSGLWPLQQVDWGGPYEFYVEGGPDPCPEVYTTCWPQPSVLKALENNRVLEFYVYCQDPTLVDMASFRVNGIPNYLNDGVAVYDEENERIWTNAFIMRFLGASGLRPIPSEGIQSTYNLTYNLLDGTTVALTGDFVLTVYQGDVNFDTEVTIEDVIFLTQYLFDNGQKAMLYGEEMEEFMDVDASGRFDLLDVQATLQITGL